jgi:ATP-dependent RNA helicase DDX35
MSYWKPIETIDRGEINLKQTTSHRNKHLPISYQRQLLPISRYRQEVLYCVERYRTVILVGETGCGKSTQIPQYLFESGWSSGGYGIVCTQPRRLAAISVCNRVCEEIGCSVGETVGYAVRFDSKCGLSTAIKYCTDGVLLRETMSDPLLTKYSVIMVDEAHERSLHSDILLGLLKKIMRKRQDLHIIIASAGLDAMLLKNFFETNKTNDIANDTSYVMSVTGRLHSVDILYLQDPTANYIRCAVNTVLNIHYNEERGDILVFLPGAEEIDSAIDLLESLYTNKNDSNDLFVLPLYSSLPHALQQRVFDVTPPTHRKVIFATNIAETSVTIEGIRYVVDSGFVKLNYFNVYNGIDALVTCNISKASSK